MTILETLEALEAKKPGRDVLFTAIDDLTAAEDIKQFYGEYSAAYGEDLANSNIGYALGYYGSDALPDVSHPVFGRSLHTTAEEAFEAGMELGKEMKRKATDEATP